MIIVKLISGLGNQLFQYAIGRQVALLKKVPLKLDLSFYQTQTLRNYKLHYYPVQAEIATAQEINSVLSIDISINSRWQRAIDKMIPFYKTLCRQEHKKRYQKERMWWMYQPEIFKVPRSAYLEGYWQHHKYFQQLPDQIFNELLLRESLRNEVEDLAAEIRSIANSVSIHIRRGDYITDPDANNMFGVLPSAYYRKAAEILSAKRGKLIFFVFSDDIEWARNNLELNHQMHFVKVQGEAEDCQELYLMSQCRNNIIANSSYSWWGAFLNRNPDKIVICPAGWSRIEEINQRIQIQLPEWVKI